MTIPQSGFKLSQLRSYNSVEALGARHSASSSAGSSSIAARQNPSRGPKAASIEPGTEMFATFFSHTQAQFSQPEPRDGGW